MEYEKFLIHKQQINNEFGFDPVFMPDYLFEFQKSLVEWALLKGRSAIFADCGLGKSPMELVWAQNVVEHTNGRVLLLTPLAVGIQMEREAQKFDIEAVRQKGGLQDTSARIIITNYEQLHHFNPADFTGVICDESSILKNFNGKYKHEINIFMRKIKYRLLATATAAPNDFVELGTSSEALGYLGHTDMLSKFFRNDMNNVSTGRYRGEKIKWRLKGHAHDAFWRWVTSWARAIRYPSDLGYDDNGFILPQLTEIDHELPVTGRTVEGVLPGMVLPAHGLQEQREERRNTIDYRCEKAAEIANSIDDYCVLWCNLNDEGDMLENMIDNAVQVSGRDSDEKKEEKLQAFTRGEFQKLVIKPKIGAWGLNWQHCNRMTYFPTHSYEQFYQAARRCWRFGQKRPVQVDLVYTEGDENMIYSLKRKQHQAIEMFDRLVAEMNNSLSIQNIENFKNNVEVPSWL